MYYAHNYETMTEDKRPQDDYMDGRDWKFETLEHGGEYPDMMPQAIRATDSQGRYCIYLPVQHNGKVVDSNGFVSDSRHEARVEFETPNASLSGRGDAPTTK
jgi:hypothetical protein